MISRMLKILGVLLWILGFLLFDIYLVDYERIIFLDVGQGDSILIQKGRFEILIDSGPDDSIVYKMGEYMRWDDRLIDVAVITHMHDDHYMGFKYLLERYDIGLFILSSNCGSLCDEFREYEYIEVSAGDAFSYSDIYLNILWPRVGVLDENLNNDSIVVLVEYLDRRFLLMGDAELGVEQLLLSNSRGYITDVDVLKAGHHCSKTASSYEMLITTDPVVVICSCGEGNKFGHPHDETISNFNMLGIDYVVTWEYGDYIVE